MNKILTFLIFLIGVLNLDAKTDTSTNCNWKSRISGFYLDDNCDSNKNTVNIVGKVSLNQIFNCKKPVQRVWKLNNTVIGNGENLYYKVTQNGSYKVCLYLYDSCNRCDTVVCGSVNITCFNPCNWKSKVNDFSVKSNCDSTRTNTYIMGSFILNSNYTCTKGKRWKWVVNNSALSINQHLYQKALKNGTYNVCLYLYDSCNNCDTSICKTITINCIPSSCNWKSRINNVETWAHCDSLKNAAAIQGKALLNQNQYCARVYRKWTINGVSAATTDNLYYPVSANGNYQVCVQLYDSCTKCDTTICDTVTINCLKTCNWKQKVNDFGVWTNCDSSRQHTYLIGRFILNKNYTCRAKKWKWLVNNTIVSTSQNLYKPITQNGSYTVCLVLFDSCNQCDTSFCKTIAVNCIPNSCSWKNRITKVETWAHCDSLKNVAAIQGKVILTQNQNCSKIYRKWTVNGVSAGMNEMLYYPVSANGNYKVCVQLYDSCTKCDTTICDTVTVNCLKSCNWKHKVNDFNVWTNCDSSRQNTYLIGRFILNKNYTCTKGKRWKWMVNNSVASYSQNLYYKISQNGTYNVCLYLYDSCNKCDTTYCKTITVNCIQKCNWKNVYGNFDAKVICDSMKNTAVILAKFQVSQNYRCGKKLYRKWLVNNSVAGYGEVLEYKVTKNGMYKVCVILYDSCNNCDTSYCRILPVNCYRLSIDDNRITNPLVLYPNPVSEMVDVLGLDLGLGEAEISILDMSGKQWIKHRIEINAENLSINVADLPSGIYLLRVEQGSTVWHLKLIKE